jgi:hypothetical protein
VGSDHYVSIADAAHTQHRERESQCIITLAPLIDCTLHTLSGSMQRCLKGTHIHSPARPPNNSLARLLARSLTSQQHRRHDSCKTDTGCTPQQTHVSDALSGDSPEPDASFAQLWMAGQQAGTIGLTDAATAWPQEICTSISGTHFNSPRYVARLKRGVVWRVMSSVKTRHIGHAREHSLTLSPVRANADARSKSSMAGPSAAEPSPSACAMPPLFYHPLHSHLVLVGH